MAFMEGNPFDKEELDLNKTNLLNGKSGPTIDVCGEHLRAQEFSELIIWTYKNFGYDVALQFIKLYTGLSASDIKNCETTDDDFSCNLVAMIKLFLLKHTSAI